MILARILGLKLMIAVLAVGATQEVFDLKVERVRMRGRVPAPRKQHGDLHIDAEGIRFKSGDGKTNIAIAMQDLREADVADPHALRFETYEVSKWEPGGRRKYTFRAGSDAPIEDLAKFLAGRVRRPVAGHYMGTSLFRIPAYHRGARGGTNGTLEIGGETIGFVSDKPADSRTWLYRDIETIGRPDSFRFRVTTKRETYVVELKSELPDAAYEFAWSKVYNGERSGW